MSAYAPAKFEIATSNCLKRRCIYKKIHYLTVDLDLGVKITQNFAPNPLHHVTYVAAKIEVDTSKGLGGDAFTRKLVI